VFLSGIDYETGGRFFFETVVGAGMWRSVFSRLDSRIHVYGSKVVVGWTYRNEIKITIGLHEKEFVKY
jgi:hypothetical protein